MIITRIIAIRQNRENKQKLNLRNVLLVKLTQKAFLMRSAINTEKQNKGNKKREGLEADQEKNEQMAECV